jgi:hypothetical protein
MVHPLSVTAKEFGTDLGIIQIQLDAKNAIQRTGDFAMSRTKAAWGFPLLAHSSQSAGEL